MPIAASDIKKYFSTTSGSAGFSNAGTGAGSLGKYMSTTEITDATLHNLFDVVTGAENLAGNDDYRCIFIRNSNSLTASNVSIWVSSETTGGAGITIGLDPVGNVAHTASPVQAATIADVDTPPSGVTFTYPDAADELSIGTLTQNQVRGVWVKRLAANTAALDLDGVVLRVTFDSPA